MPKTTDDPARGTGRTTGLMLQAMANAILNPDQDVEFVDHAPASVESARLLEWCLKDHARALGLTLRVRRIGQRLFVRSPMSEILGRPIK